MVRLGMLLEKKDPVAAVTWYRKASEAKNPNAMYNLALILEKGAAGVPKDPAEAMMWLKKAAEEYDHAPSKNRLAGKAKKE